MPVDSFKYLPGSIAAYYRNMAVQRRDPLPWTPLQTPLSRARFALVTTAGIYAKGTGTGFDQEGERKNPMWGDPSYRRLPRDIQRDQVGASHLHLNNRDILADLNIVLPVQRFTELESEGVIGSLAPTSYSFMGYQMDLREWRERYAPEVAQAMLRDGVNAVLVTPG